MNTTERKPFDVDGARRRYFLLCRKMDLDAEARHDFNRAVTGKASTKAFAPRDWMAVIERLRKDAGEPARRARRTGPPGDPYAPASEAQIHTIWSLRKSAGIYTMESFAWHRLVKDAPDRTVPEMRPVDEFRIADLCRKRAQSLIVVLKRMAQQKRGQD
jgi:hypothetical protein